MILYLHGFRSSPAAAKSQTLFTALEAQGMAAEFASPALSPVPDAAIAQADALIAAARQRGEAITLIGSSLGGHYATTLAERHALPAVLINPAVIAAIDLSLFIGPQTNFHSGEAFDFTPAHAAQLQAQVPAQITPSHYQVLLAEADEVLDYRQALAFYRGSALTVLPGGDHTFSAFADFIPAIIAAHRQRRATPPR